MTFSNRFKIKLLFCIIVVGAFSCTDYQEEKIEKLKSEITWLKKETIPIRFKILSRTPEFIHVGLKLYDADGAEIKYSELKMPGRELSFDFYIVQANGKQIAFPYKIFTDQIAPKNGTLLIPMYDKDGFPLILHHQQIDASTTIALTDLFAEIKSGEIHNRKKQFGSLVHDLDGVRLFEEGVVYKIIIHSKGGIEIVAE